MLEITEITDRVGKAGGPALLFTKPKGYSIPVLMNQFGSDERMCLALRAASYDELAARVAKLTNLEAPGSTWDKLRALARLKDLAALQPRIVKQRAPVRRWCSPATRSTWTRCPILQVLAARRRPLHHAAAGLHPSPARPAARNVGMYRLQVFDKRTTGMHWHLHKDAAEHYRGLRRGAWRWRWPSAPTRPSPTRPRRRCPAR